LRCRERSFQKPARVMVPAPLPPSPSSLSFFPSPDQMRNQFDSIPGRKPAASLHVRAGPSILRFFFRRSFFCRSHAVAGPRPMLSFDGGHLLAVLLFSCEESKFSFALRSLLPDRFLRAEVYTCLHRGDSATSTSALERWRLGAPAW